MSLTDSLTEINRMLHDIFNKADVDKNGRLSKDEAARLLLICNSKFGRNYGSNELERYFSALDTSRDESIDFDEFKAHFIKTFMK